MGHYTGIQIDLRLSRTLPSQIASWLAKHAMGDGNLEDMNRLMSAGDGIMFPHWTGGSLKFVDDHPEFGSHWHLKTNGATKRFDENKLAFFLHEIQPWLVMREDEVLARTIYEEQQSSEHIFWVDRIDTLVRRRNGTQYGYDDRDMISQLVSVFETKREGFSSDHPRRYTAEELAEPLGMVADYPEQKFADLQIFNFQVNHTVSPKLEEKRILTEEFNKRYAGNKLAEVQAELAAMEGKNADS